MPKYKVLTTFRDKNTGNYHAANSDYETDNESRAKELQCGGFLDLEENENSNLKLTVEQVKKQFTIETPKEELEAFLAQEKAAENRKGAVEHIESLLELGADDESGKAE